ncbi:MAG: hypothetical protein WBW74_21390, partial [Xanthobacteraceae bacterium]
MALRVAAPAWRIITSAGAAMPEAELAARQRQVRAAQLAAARADKGPKNMQRRTFLTLAAAAAASA